MESEVVEVLELGTLFQEVLVAKLEDVVELDVVSALASDVVESDVVSALASDVVEVLE